MIGRVLLAVATGAPLVVLAEGGKGDPTYYNGSVHLPDLPAPGGACKSSCPVFDGGTCSHQPVFTGATRQVNPHAGTKYIRTLQGPELKQPALLVTSYRVAFNYYTSGYQIADGFWIARRNVKPEVLVDRTDIHVDDINHAIRSAVVEAESVLVGEEWKRMSAIMREDYAPSVRTLLNTVFPNPNSAEDEFLPYAVTTHIPDHYRTGQSQLNRDDLLGLVLGHNNRWQATVLYRLAYAYALKKADKRQAAHILGLEKQLIDEVNSYPARAQEIKERRTHHITPYKGLEQILADNPVTFSTEAP